MSLDVAAEVPCSGIVEVRMWIKERDGYFEAEVWV